MTRVRNRFTKVVFRGRFHLAQHIGRDLRWRVFVVANANPRVAVLGFDDLVRDHFNVPLHDVVRELPSNQAFDREQSVIGVGDRLPFGTLANQSLTGLAVTRRLTA